VTDFLRLNHVQVAVNANLFDPQDYYLSAGTPMDIFGLTISKGVVVSPQDSRSYSACVTFASNNVAEIIYTNWPARSNAGIYTAVAGDYNILIQGVNVGYQYRNNSDSIHARNPRTAFGLSQEKRYLFVLTIDGRQPGYSDGALDFETAAWLLLLGAYDGVNLDGGGSTTLVMQNSTGVPVRLNRSSAVADSGKERTVGSHFGIFAKPVPDFIQDVTASPDDRTALITWTTETAATGQVEYGPTTNLAFSSGLQSEQTTNHSVILTGLTPNTAYYYRVDSNASNAPHSSPIYAFITTNYVTTNLVFDLTNLWKYSTDNLDGVNWMSLDYDDSGWKGPFPGILYADTTGSNSAILQENTQLPLDPSTGYPYTTYYFRTPFNVTNADPGISLYASSYVDDGAVFYLNGVEVYRLRMPDAPASISYSDFALTFPCDGDATCSDDFQIPLSPELLQLGQNVLAVEVHNYNSRSHDITFGASLVATIPISKTAQMQISLSGGLLTITWTGSDFRLQQAASLNGPWSDISGSGVASPWQVVVTGQAQFFRLQK
jgi:hypothetical protein